MDSFSPQRNITIILHRPKHGGNIGAAARAMKNMGFTRLIVSEGGSYGEEEMKMMSTRFAADIVDHIAYHDHLLQALADTHYVVGTTARTGAHRGPTRTPREVAPEIVALARENRVALLFGAEDRGLTNEAIRLCDQLITIPTAGEMRSLNLAQAVLVVCYEVFLASYTPPATFLPRLAYVTEREEMYRHLQSILMEIGFLNPQNPEYFMTHIRSLLARTGLLSRDVKILRGICRQISWAIQGRNHEPP